MNNEINYDQNAIEQHIDYFNNILEQQKFLSNVIQNNSNAQIQKTTNIIHSMTPIVNQHYQTIHNLDLQINKITLKMIYNSKISLKLTCAPILVKKLMKSIHLYLILKNY